MATENQLTKTILGRHQIGILNNILKVFREYKGNYQTYCWESKTISMSEYEAFVEDLQSFLLPLSEENRKISLNDLRRITFQLHLISSHFNAFFLPTHSSMKNAFYVCKNELISIYEDCTLPF